MTVLNTRQSGETSSGPIHLQPYQASAEIHKRVWKRDVWSKGSPVNSRDARDSWKPRDSVLDFREALIHIGNLPEI